MIPLCPHLTKFTVPGGGGQLSSWLDVVRSTVREAERNYVEFMSYETSSEGKEYAQEYTTWIENNQLCLKILNRMSDFMFVLKRFVILTLKEQEDLYKISDKNNKN